MKADIIEYGYKIDGVEHFICSRSREGALRFAADELAFKGVKSEVNVKTFQIVNRYEALGKEGEELHKAMRKLVDFFIEAVAVEEQEHTITPKANWDGNT